MKIIGITGISGSGKTKATKMLAAQGGLAIDTDTLAHALMKKGQPAYDKIIKAFGTEILDETGEIHRPSLGKLVFGNTDNMRRLEAILHPAVAEKTTEIITDTRKAGTHMFVIIDAPLLIEAGMHTMCDSCWLITASHETRLKRIIKRDNISVEAAGNRLKSRKSDETLKPYAHVVIENDGNDLYKLQETILEALNKVLEA